MTLELFGHPFSSYTMKVLIPLYENGTDFTFRIVAPDEPETVAAFQALAPLGKFPLLRDGATAVRESTIIVEYLDLKHPGPVPLIPIAADAALEVRALDRVFDNYVMTPMQAVVANALRPAEARDPYGVEAAEAALAAGYAWLDALLAGRIWAAGEAFSLADCAAAPALLYADWVAPIPKACATLRAYRARLLARPSFARCVDEARPYRAFFPLGAPDRD